MYRENLNFEQWMSKQPCSIRQLIHHSPSKANIQAGGAAERHISDGRRTLITATSVFMFTAAQQRFLFFYNLLSLTCWLRGLRQISSVSVIFTKEKYEEKSSNSSDEDRPTGDFIISAMTLSVSSSTYNIFFISQDFIPGTDTTNLNTYER